MQELAEKALFLKMPGKDTLFFADPERNVQKDLLAFMIRRGANCSFKQKAPMVSGPQVFLARLR